MPEVKDLGLANNEIVSVTRTSGTGLPGSIDTYTITVRDGTTFTFNITNGNNGLSGLEAQEFTDMSAFETYVADDSNRDAIACIVYCFYEHDEWNYRNVNFCLGYGVDEGSNVVQEVILKFLNSGGSWQTISSLGSYNFIRVYHFEDAAGQAVVLTSRTIAGLSLESDITENALFDKMSIKGRYATLSALQTANPNHGYCYLVEENNHWYYWNGAAWTDGGVYQATVITDGSVTINKFDASIANSLYNWKTCNATRVGISYSGTNKIVTAYNSGYFIDVSNIRYLKFSATIGQWYNEFTFVDDSDNILGYHQCNAETIFTNELLIVPIGATKCYISTGDTNLNTFSAIFLDLNETKNSLDGAEKITKAIELKELPIQDIKVGYYNTSNGYSSHTGYRTVSYDVSLYKKVYISYDSFEEWLPTYILWKNGEIIYNSGYKGTSFSGWIDVSNADQISIMEYYVEVGRCSVKAYQITSTKQLSYWDGKKIVWFGTSIPAAGLIGYNQTNTYPNYVGNMLGANVYNEAVGSSAIHCRRYSKVSATNPYGFTENFATSSRALASSLEEKQWIINWLKAHLNGGVYEEGYENDCAFDDTIFTSGVPASLDADTIEFYKDCSYERKLDKYLGTNKRCDLYVIDHGYNDYTLEDVNFDESNPYDLHYFRGAMNFIIARILADNPRAKIVILTHYTDQIPSGQYNYKLTEYQIKVADDWNIDRLELYKKLGFSVKYKINTQWGWSNGYLVDTGSVISNVTVKSRWMQDDLHPHTDLTNECITFIARVVSTWLENDVRSGWY